MSTKTLIFSVFLILSVIGCRESTVTEPIEALGKEGNFIIGDTINLCCLLPHPGGGNCQLNGVVVYDHQIIENQTGEDGLFLVSLALLMNSKLCGIDNPNLTNWLIEGQSEDEFYVSEEGIYILNKVYKIGNRMDVVLVVQYLVTSDGMGIPNLWIQEIDQYSFESIKSERRQKVYQ